MQIIQIMQNSNDIVDYFYTYYILSIGGTN